MQNSDYNGDPQDVFCDGVRIGQIYLNKDGMHVGLGLKGEVVSTTFSRPDTYRALRREAFNQGLLKRVRKGVYRAADST